LKILNVLLLLLVPVTAQDSTATPTVSLERVVLPLVELLEVHHLPAVVRVPRTFIDIIRGDVRKECMLLRILG
jgi:hypothetical protein